MIGEGGKFEFVFCWFSIIVSNDFYYVLGGRVKVFNSVDCLKFLKILISIF